MQSLFRLFRLTAMVFILCFFVAGCAGKKTVRLMETTGYCNCGKCCSWERGSWKYLKLDFWNRYISAGRAKGKKYSGLTASGKKPVTPRPGFFSLDTLTKPWMIPVRIVFFPWCFFQRDGTVAADTKYYPFGTRIYVPGYGWGVIEDRGGAIKGPKRLDLYYSSHNKALQWGRRNVEVEFYDDK
jgi:hypothetical protein